MLSLVACIALLQQPVPQPAAMTPWAEMSCPFDHPGPPSDLEFLPGMCALPVSEGSAHGPSFGVWINLDTLNLLYVPAYDLEARNTVNAAMLFKRAYRSDLAVQGKHSPGLPNGWVHEFDAFIPYPEGDTWQPLEINWPTGAVQKLVPEIVDGKPSGKFNHEFGCPFIAVGTPGDAVNKWESIKLSWDGGGYWIFRPHECGAFVLREIGNEQTYATHSDLLYMKDRRLGEVQYAGDKVPFLICEYNDDGYLSGVRNRLGLHVDFQYAPADESDGSPMELSTVSEIADPGKTGAVITTYGYHVWQGWPLLTSISIPSPADNGKTLATSQIFFKSGAVVKVQDADGNSKEFRHGPGGLTAS